MACKAIYIRIILEGLGHIQPPTPLQTDNAMADGVINGKVQPKQHGHEIPLATQSRMSMTIPHLLATRQVELRQLLDKHHPETHHRNMHKEFLTQHIVLEMLRMA
jgi:hypothetical protein